MIVGFKKIEMNLFNKKSKKENVLYDKISPFFSLLITNNIFEKIYFIGNSKVFGYEKINCINTFDELDVLIKKEMPENSFLDNYEYYLFQDKLNNFLIFVIEDYYEYTNKPLPILIKSITITDVQKISKFELLYP